MASNFPLIELKALPTGEDRAASDYRTTSVVSIGRNGIVVPYPSEGLAEEEPLLPAPETNNDSIREAATNARNCGRHIFLTVVTEVDPVAWHIAIPPNGDIERAIERAMHEAAIRGGEVRCCESLPGTDPMAADLEELVFTDYLPERISSLSRLCGLIHDTTRSCEIDASYVHAYLRALPEPVTLPSLSEERRGNVIRVLEEMLCAGELGTAPDIAEGYLANVPGYWLTDTLVRLDVAFERPRRQAQYIFERSFGVPMLSIESFSDLQQVVRVLVNPEERAMVYDNYLAALPKHIPAHIVERVVLPMEEAPEAPYVRMRLEMVKLRTDRSMGQQERE